MKQLSYFSLRITYTIVVCLATSSIASSIANATNDPIDWICPDGYSGVVRHPYDCQLFYQCSSTGSPLLLTCPSGQYFNPKNEYCMNPEYVPDCDGGSPPPIITTTLIPETTKDPIDWICPDSYDGYIRHPYDCQLFYECRLHSTPQLYECPTGLYFSPINEQCENQSDVPDCQDGSPPSISPTPRPSRTNKFDIAFD